jgi:transcriptional regulator with GAF, ATPase, and Fis domain
MPDALAITLDPRPRCANCNAFLRREHAAAAATGAAVLCDPCERKELDRQLAATESQPQATTSPKSWRSDLRSARHNAPQIVAVLRLDPRPRPRCAPADRLSFRDAVAQFKREFIQEVMARRCGNAGESAAEMGMHRHSLARMMGELGMR